MAQFTDGELDEIVEQVAAIHFAVAKLMGHTERRQPDFNHGHLAQLVTTRDVVLELYNRVRSLAVRYGVSEH